VNKSNLSKSHLLILVILCVSFPLLLLIFESKLITYLHIHFIVSALLIICYIVLIYQKYFMQTKFLWIFFFSLIFYPFFIIAAFPFSIKAILAPILLIVLGLVMPFVSLKATWWFYTIGGRYPLPDEHKWLNKKRGVGRENKEKYSDFVARVGKMLVPIGVVVGMLLAKTQNDVFIVMLLKLLSLLGIFGLGLTVGAKLKKRKISSQS